MAIKSALKSQYQAALAMLQEVIQDCPEELWDAEQPENRFWQVADHAGVCTDTKMGAVDCGPHF